MSRAFLVMVLGVASGVTAALHAQQPSNLAAATAAIMRADEDFNRAVAERNRTRFASFIADDAVFVSGTSTMRGVEEIIKGWDAFFQPDGATLTWRPTKGEVLVGGDVGYTVGSWVRRAQNSSGTMVESTGQYHTVWRKQPDGTWKVVYDIGSAGQ